MENVFKTIIVPAKLVGTIKQLTWLVAWPEQSESMWNTPLSTTWEAPATHFISSWLINNNFASLVPCYGFNWDWEWTKLYNWQSEYITKLTGTPQAQIEWLFSMLDISEQESFQAMERLNLKLISDIWNTI
jgi:hypothetical protein